MEHSGKGAPLEILTEICKTFTFVPEHIPGVLQPKKKVLLRIITELFRVFIGVLGSQGFLTSV